MRIFQKGFNYSQDGDGNRLVYHLQGCNMACKWCANPEGMDPLGVIVVDPEWILSSCCPHGAITGKNVDRSRCASCEKKECITEHNTKGMYLSYEEMTPEEVICHACSNELMFYDGGGVTFSGGEATVQFEELFTVLRGLKDRGIHTCIESNGTHRKLTELFPYVDLLILDCKHMDSKKHKEYTGVGNEQILKNIRLAAESHPRVHIRVPLIGGVNNRPEDLKEFLAFFKEIQNEHVTFEVLAYHEFGKPKWEQCGYTYEMTEQAKVKEETLQAFRKEIAAQGGNYKST